MLTVGLMAPYDGWLRVHDRVTIQWQPGSWRMHVPFRYEKNSGIGLADSAQIYFPRKQIAELTIILKGSVG